MFQSLLSSSHHEAPIDLIQHHHLQKTKPPGHVISSPEMILVLSPSTSFLAGSSYAEPTFNRQDTIIQLLKASLQENSPHSFSCTSAITITKSKHAHIMSDGKHQNLREQRDNA